MGYGIKSVHEGEPLLVLLGLLSSEFFLELNFVLFLVVMFESGFDPDAAGHDCGDAASEGVDLEVVD